MAQGESPYRESIWMLHNYAVIFGSPLSGTREKSSFDKLRMISRYARLSNLQLVCLLGHAPCQSRRFGVVLDLHIAGRCSAVASNPNQRHKEGPNTTRQILTKDTELQSFPKLQSSAVTAYLENQRLPLSLRCLRGESNELSKGAGLGDRQTVFKQTANVHFDGLIHVLRDLIVALARCHASRQIG
jgi:hypothetical protein